IDEAIMMCQAESASSPTLRIYRWLYPCVSIGRFQSLDDILNREGALPVVKRPTGGGIVFHNEFSFTYSIVYREDSFVSPKGVSNSYRKIHNGISKGLKSLGIGAALHMPGLNGRKSLSSKFCFSSPCEFDIVCGNRKIAGAAQRRRYGVVLHQGEVSLGLDVWPKWSYNVSKIAIMTGLSEQLEARFVEGRLSEKERILAEELNEAKRLICQAT
ncbi:MAG: hypothetical protein ABH847_01485, partial [Candidatus Omnitrophota bacterium]